MVKDPGMNKSFMAITAPRCPPNVKRRRTTSEHQDDRDDVYGPTDTSLRLGALRASRQDLELFDELFFERELVGELRTGLFDKMSRR